MREVVFVDFARTAFGNRGGALRSFADVDLGAACLKALAEKSGIWEKGGKDAVDSIFSGAALRSKVSGAPPSIWRARQASRNLPKPTR